MNKKELLYFLIEEIVTKYLGGILILSTAFESVVLSKKTCDVSALKQCNHYKADTMIFLHLLYYVGHAYVRTVDSDIVVLAIHFFATLGLPELWVGFGSGENSTIFRFVLSSPVLDLPDI